MTTLNYGIVNSLILLTEKPLSERLKFGLLNMVLGLGIVFAVLAFLIFIISLLKYLPALLSGNKEENGQEEITTATNNVTNDVTSYNEPEADLTDDNELIAVITAAISAFESEVNSDNSAGGFVVRSIRRISNKR